jgi:hypothetical protein
VDELVSYNTESSTRKILLDIAIARGAYGFVKNEMDVWHFTL